MTPILWAIYSTAMKQISKSKPESDLKVLEYVSYLGGIQLFLLVLVIGEFPIFLDNFLNPVLFLCAAYLGIGCYIIGYYIWQTSQKKLKSSNVASFLYIEPFITLILSFIFQRSEVIVFWNILGGIIVFVAVILINYKQN
jgi:drug/metabolite transporter (DMT)-like permease